MRIAMTLALLLTVLCPPPGRADTAPRLARVWTTVWAASPQPRWEGDFPLSVLAPPALWNQTVRQRVKLSLGGARLRLVLSNRYGDTPVTIGAATLARAAEKDALQPETLRPVTFGGKPAATILPGADIVSDPVDLTAAAREALAVSLYFPRPTAVSTFHWDGGETTFLTTGDATSNATLDVEGTTTTRLVLSAILAETPAGTGTVVALGDSITDGAASTLDANQRWPDHLATRLAPQGISVVNAGISGNRLLRAKMGESALARFDRDVAAVPGVKAVVVLIGINDISWPGHLFAPELEMPTADELIDGYRQLAAKAHARNIPIIGATLTPFEGALGDTPFRGYYTPAKDRLRQAVNAWIRTGGAFDAVVDLDAALRDPADSARLRPAFDSGDHLHASDAGNAAIAEAVAAVLESSGLLVK
ncbi:SGNH/GDSL hydrolase family protein [Ancylobacter terrae]|uniref:SGNH/GDSL hydrolase family protein n=1 Tax=Ancylobacter sp. sgz301288 TaxID=3342077 RepID=UPI00385A0A41